MVRARIASGRSAGLDTIDLLRSVPYTGTVPLILNGNGNRIDGDDTWRMLNALSAESVTVNALDM